MPGSLGAKVVSKAFTAAQAVCRTLPRRRKPLPKGFAGEVLHLYHAPASGCGAFTTGGTESILVAMKAYRDAGRERGIAAPNIVCGATAHAASPMAWE